MLACSYPILGLAVLCCGFWVFPGPEWVSVRSPKWVLDFGVSPARNGFRVPSPKWCIAVYPNHFMRPALDEGPASLGARGQRGPAEAEALLARWVYYSSGAASRRLLRPY
jgi:hypothetical protein